MKAKFNTIIGVFALVAAAIMYYVSESDKTLSDDVKKQKRNSCILIASIGLMNLFFGYLKKTEL